MRVFAYCCAAFAETTRRAAGVEPTLSPPVTAETFDPGWLEGQQLIYLDLHGWPGEAAWRGDYGLVALTAEQVRAADLGGAVVFATNCYLADEGSPMMDALLAAGARYVVGGEGENWASTRRPSGAALLGQRFRQILAMGVVEPLRALALAKLWVGWDLRKQEKAGAEREVLANKDTLAFRAYYRPEVGNGTDVSDKTDV